jgi:hypothetical protein
LSGRGGCGPPCHPFLSPHSDDTFFINCSKLAFREAGIACATLGVDSESPTGATGVYRRVGFEVVNNSISFGMEA